MVIFKVTALNITKLYKLSLLPTHYLWLSWLFSKCRGNQDTIFQSLLPCMVQIYSLSVKGLCAKFGSWKRSRRYYSPQVFVVRLVNRGENHSGLSVCENYRFTAESIGRCFLRNYWEPLPFPTSLPEPVSTSLQSEFLY